MSALSEKVATALYTKLNVTAVTTTAGATGGVFNERPPDTATPATLPVVIFQRQAPGSVGYTFGHTLTHEDDLWLIKAMADPDNSTAFTSPLDTVETILAACETAIGTSLTLSGGSVTWAVYRVADIPVYKERVNDRTIWHGGFLLRVVAAP